LFSAKLLYRLMTTHYIQAQLGDRFQATNEERFVTRTLNLLQLASALSNTRAAMDISQRALAIVDYERIRDAAALETAN